MVYGVWFIVYGVELLVDGIEAFAKDAGDIGLADERIGIDVTNDAHDLLRLMAPRQDSDDMHRLLGVPACAVEDSHAAIDGLVDSRSDLGIVVLGIDEELHRTPEMAHHRINGERVGDSHTEAVEDTPGLEISDLLRRYTVVDELFGQRKHVGRSDDDQIADDHDPSERDIAIVMHNLCHDIRATGRAVVGHNNTQCHTKSYTTDDAGRNGIVDERRGADRNDAIPHSQGERAEERTHTEPPIDGEVRDSQQDAIEHERSEPYGNRASVHRKCLGEHAAGSVIDDGAYTRQSAGNDVVRQDDPVDNQCHGEHGKEDRHVLDSHLDGARSVVTAIQLLV